MTDRDFRTAVNVLAVVFAATMFLAALPSLHGWAIPAAAAAALLIGDMAGFLIAGVIDHRIRNAKRRPHPKG